MTDIQASAAHAADSLERVRLHIKAGTFNATPADMIEWGSLSIALVVAKHGPADELLDLLARVDEFVRRVCPQARGEGN